MMATELLDLACTAKPWLDEDTSPNEIAPLRLSFGGILSEDEDEYERQVDWERVNQEQVAWHLVRRPMMTTEKPKGLAKIWRETQRPFKKIWREIKRPVRQAKSFLNVHAIVNDAVAKHSAITNDLVQKHYDRVEQELKQHCNYMMQKLHNDIIYSLQRRITASIWHQKTFPRFKNIHQGQEIVLVACGPTAKDYERISGAIHIGVNRAFKLENIDLDYLFLQDYANVKPYIKEANRYRVGHCIKFYGHDHLHPHLTDLIIPENEIIEANALRFITGSVRHDVTQPLFLEIDEIYNLACPAAPERVMLRDLV